MSYTPTDWKTGDVITADKLNNMESGIENAQLFIVSVTQNENEFTADKTFTEIQTAFLNGASVVFALVRTDSYGTFNTYLDVSSVLPDTAIMTKSNISLTLEASTLHIGELRMSMNSDNSLVVDMNEFTVSNASIVPH